MHLYKPVLFCTWYLYIPYEHYRGSCLCIDVLNPVCVGATTSSGKDDSCCPGDNSQAMCRHRGQHLSVPHLEKMGNR